mmetsp:Transcript_40157/g.78922  ORF Transcript_40157/g.78922 Transcript_40157/m.78922 type:complete len:187 (+) Transcript_40157:116-676(+)
MRRRVADAQNWGGRSRGGRGRDREGEKPVSGNLLEEGPFSIGGNSSEEEEEKEKEKNQDEKKDPADSLQVVAADVVSIDMDQGQPGNFLKQEQPIQMLPKEMAHSINSEVQPSLLQQPAQNQQYQLQPQPLEDQLLPEESLSDKQSALSSNFSLGLGEGADSQENDQDVVLSDQDLDGALQAFIDD